MNHRMNAENTTRMPEPPHERGKASYQRRLPRSGLKPVSNIDSNTSLARIPSMKYRMMHYIATLTRREWPSDR
jgi:hypothetical protein